MQLEKLRKKKEESVQEQDARRRRDEREEGTSRVKVLSAEKSGEEMLPKAEWQHTPAHREAPAALKASWKTAADAAVTSPATDAAPASSASAGPAVAVSASAAPTDPQLADSLQEDFEASPTDGSPTDCQNPSWTRLSGAATPRR